MLESSMMRLSSHALELASAHTVIKISRTSMLLPFAWVRTETPRKLASVSPRAQLSERESTLILRAPSLESLRDPRPQSQRASHAIDARHAGWSIWRAVHAWKSMSKMEDSRWPPSRPAQDAPGMEVLFATSSQAYIAVMRFSVDDREADRGRAATRYRCHSCCRGRRHGAFRATSRVTELKR
jgi:hypothetical protein